MGLLYITSCNLVITKMTRLTILFVGTTRCGNCTVFKPEWQRLKECVSKGECLDIKDIDFTLQEYIVSSHEMLPAALGRTVSFYPFVMLVPTDYLEANLHNPDESFVLVGEAMYTYRSMKNGMLSYRLGSSVNESPDMRYPRTADGIVSWVKQTAIQSIQMLAPRYYPEVVLPDNVVDKSGSGLRMKSLVFNDDESSGMDLYIPSLNKEYRVIPGGAVMCRRVLNVHS
jgi:hypothetical protein